MSFSKIKEGGYGKIYALNDEAYKKNLSEKIINGISVLNELGMLTKIPSHPNIIKLTTVLDYDNLPDQIVDRDNSPLKEDQRYDNIHFVFPKADQDLGDYIYKTEINDINFYEIQKLMFDILCGVKHLHGNGVLHRDLKPGNILIFKEGIEKRAVICDFGMSKFHTLQTVQTLKTYTSWYRPPEIAMGDKEYDFRADIWSLGCIFFEMVARRPFIKNVIEDDDYNSQDADILKRILRKTSEKYNPTDISKKIKLLSHINIDTFPIKKYSSFKTAIGFAKSGEDLFNSQAICGTGKPYAQFINLIEKMLTIDFEKRFNIDDCINHNFFKKFKIVETRYLCHDEPYEIIPCIERAWMAENVFKIWNERPIWYSHRMIFHAMHAFDKYLVYMRNSGNISEDVEEDSVEGVGKIFYKDEAYIRFKICVYMYVKYFSTVYICGSIRDIFPDIPENEIEFCENFESDLVLFIFDCELYHHTIFEEEKKEILDSKTIKDLIVLYTCNYSFSGMTVSQLYKYYCDFLKGVPKEEIVKDIDRSKILK